MYQFLLVIIYLTFISLGLPDSLLGSAWPVIYVEQNVPISYASIIYIVITCGTICSSLLSDRLTRLLGPGKVTVLSTLLSVFSLFGFSISTNFTMLILFAIPYGIGAGGVDAAMNNYVAINYSGKHMSFLHAMWGVGASISPYIMSRALLNDLNWHMGYRTVGFIQLILCFLILISLPMWRNNKKAGSDIIKDEPLKIGEMLKIKGNKELLLTFFSYCAMEQTVILWASSYLKLGEGFGAAFASKFASMFCLGMMIGRFISGFITKYLNDDQMINLGYSIILLGIILVMIPFGTYLSLIGLLLIGLGCAPIYPSIIHSIPIRFGEDKSQGIIGLQMAVAYMGNLLGPPIFGIISRNISVRLLPYYLCIFFLTSFLSHHKLQKMN